MRAFTKVTAKAVPFPRMNVDTDIIIPAKHLKTITRSGLGKHAFETVRYRADGSHIADNVFDSPKYAGSEILIAGRNFGCGSSREHAPWALADMGFRVVIAPGFADIFAGNCIKNGLLTVTLKQEDVDALVLAAEGGVAITVDLEDQTVTAGNAHYAFEFNPVHKKMLLEGLDEIGQTLAASPAIKSYEAKQAAKTPWLFGGNA